MKMTIFRSSMLRVAILALGAIALSALPAMAQDPAPPPQGQGGPHYGGRGGPGMGGHQLEFLTMKLNLTPDQVTQVKAIDADTWSQMKALHENTSMAEQDKRTQMAAIHKASHDKFLGVLTDDQKTQYAALEAQMREHHGNHGGGNGTPPPPPQQ
jgi:Spy/CpxP family protein refolding chaperone